MWRQGLDAGDANIVLQAVPKAVQDLPKVAVAIELAKTEEARKLIQVGIHDTAAMTRPYALPPGTPNDRVQRLSGHYGANDSSQATNSIRFAGPQSQSGNSEIIHGERESVPAHTPVNSLTMDTAPVNESASIRC